ncbi:hypothetical protein LCGC14_2448710 [marine sediment metagenome]|uniref:Uncharacterized protein n=1 Tax=marine sediment metagenome TaxID=412755 RepID=A0A0F9EAM2_9ZZZZ
MRIRLIIFCLSSMIVGFVLGLPGDQLWVVFPGIAQGYTAFHLWRDLE